MCFTWCVLIWRLVNLEINFSHRLVKIRILLYKWFLIWFKLERQYSFRVSYYLEIESYGFFGWNIFKLGAFSVGPKVLGVLSVAITAASMLNHCQLGLLNDTIRGERLFRPTFFDQCRLDFHHWIKPHIGKNSNANDTLVSNVLLS